MKQADFCRGRRAGPGAAACAPADAAGARRCSPTAPSCAARRTTTSTAPAVEGAERARPPGRRSRTGWPAAALADCTPMLCNAIARGELAMGMTREQVMAATHTGPAAWEERGGGRIATLTPPDEARAPHDVVGEVAFVTLQNGRVRGYAYREPQGVRLGVVARRTRRPRARPAPVPRRCCARATTWRWRGDFDRALDRYDRADVIVAQRPGGHAAHRARARQAAAAVRGVDPLPAVPAPARDRAHPRLRRRRTRSTARRWPRPAAASWSLERDRTMSPAGPPARAAFRPGPGPRRSRWPRAPGAGAYPAMPAPESLPAELAAALAHAGAHRRLAAALRDGGPAPTRRRRCWTHSQGAAARRAGAAAPAGHGVPLRGEVGGEQRRVRVGRDRGAAPLDAVAWRSRPGSCW